MQFLVYRPGDFFQRHPTVAMVTARRHSARAPRVGERLSDPEGDPSTSTAYRGGALTLYGLFEQVGADDTVGFPLEAKEGLLLTFPADVMHEVRPVETGQRYTVVTWFEDEGSEDPS